MKSWNEFKKTMVEEDAIFNFARLGDIDSLIAIPQPISVIDKKNSKGHSALMLAVYNGNYIAAQFLLEQGADPNSTDSAGSTVLMGAAFKGDLQMVKLLQRAGADMFKKNEKAQNALDFAKMFEKLEIVEFLSSI